MASAQLYGSVVASRRCFVPSSRLLHFSPLSSRVSLSALNDHTVSASKDLRLCALNSHISISGFAKRQRVIAFDANENASSVLEYTEDSADESMISSLNVEPIDENTGLDKEISAPTKNYAKIHDFCLGIPFGGFLLSMGIIGFLLWRSTESLILGIAPGFAIFALGIISLNVWRGGKSSVPFILAQFAVAAALTWKYFQAYTLTKKLLPWGFYGIISTAMSCFYSYVLLAGGNPPPKKKLASDSS